MVSKSESINIQICSDLHIEFHASYADIPKDIIVPASPILALLGDIGLPFQVDDQGIRVYEQFLLDQAERFEKVFVIAGNHEYYSSENTMDEIKEEIYRICNLKPDILYFLDNSSIVLNDIRFTGSTLWSFIPPEDYNFIKNSYKGFRLINKKKIVDEIETNNKLITVVPEDITKIHTEAVEFIKFEIEKFKENKEKAIILLTHHAPTYQNVVAKEDPVTSVDATNLEYLYCKGMFWFFGHTHFNSKQVINEAVIISNQRGYYKNRLVDDYMNNLVINLAES